MSKFKIESGIPIPAIKRKGYPFGDMNIGDSFAFGVDRRKAMSAYAQYFARKNPPVRFAFRKTSDDTVRVWRAA